MGAIAGKREVCAPPGLVPTVVGADNLRSYVNETATDYRAFDMDVAESAMTDAWKSAWAAKRDEVYKFRDDTIGAWWITLMITTRARFEQADRYACTLQAWRADFAARGGHAKTPDPIVPGQPGGGFDWEGVKNLLYIGAGIYVVAQVAPIVAPMLKEASQSAAKSMRERRERKK